MLCAMQLGAANMALRPQAADYGDNLGDNKLAVNRNNCKQRGCENLTPWLSVMFAKPVELGKLNQIGSGAPESTPKSKSRPDKCE